MVQKLDKEEIIVPSRVEWIRILGVCIVTGVVLNLLNVYQTVPEAVLMDILIGCLLFASITDVYIGKAYNFTWWMGMISSFLNFLHKCGQMSNYHFVMLSISLFIFVLLQQTLFVRFYGRADCHAFSVCALAEGSLGMGMLAFWVHMVLAFGLLVIVQGTRCNIGKCGRLKREVPFLPYITAAFLIIIMIVTGNM